MNRHVKLEGETLSGVVLVAGVYLSTGAKPIVNMLPGEGHLFLPSEGIRLLGS